MSALLSVLWTRVELAGRAMLTDSGLYQWGEDDDGMKDAADDDLLGWVDDCADRLGASESDFRAAVLDYVIARSEGATLDPADRAGALENLRDVIEGEANTWRAIANRTGEGADADKLRECEDAAEELDAIIGED